MPSIRCPTRQFPDSDLHFLAGEMVTNHPAESPVACLYHSRKQRPREPIAGWNHSPPTGCKENQVRTKQFYLGPGATPYFLKSRFEATPQL